MFDPLRKERPTDLAKVQPIEGDITQPELAIAASDITLLTRTVNVVFHSAATVKFDEKLKLSVTINMLGTQRLVELCKKMDRLECLVRTPPPRRSRIDRCVFVSTLLITKTIAGARFHGVLQLR